MATGRERAYALIRFLVRLLTLRFRGDLNTRTRSSEVRTLLEVLGGTWIKLGQLMALRRDVFSWEFCQEMSKVQDRAIPFRTDIAREILERTLNQPLGSVFEDFSEPVAAASIGQVHSARLRCNGTRVAIKIRRPGISEQVRKDLRFMGLVVRAIQRLSIRKTFAWEGLLWELRLALVDELDYQIEADSLTRMRKTLKAHDIYVPKVFAEYSTKEVLVMEFVEGVPMSDFVAVLHEDPDRLTRWIAENEIDPEKVGRDLYLSLNRQIFEDNLFHGDLHPGNIVLLRKSRVALIDFGAVGSLDVQFIDKLRLYYRALTQRDYHAAVDILLLLAPQNLDTMNSRRFRRRYLSMLRKFEFQTSAETLPYHDRSFVHAFIRIMSELSSLGIPLEWTFMRANRAQVTLDASLMFLMPDVNYIELTGTYFAEAEVRGLTRLAGADSRRSVLVSTLTLADLALNQIEEGVSIGVELSLQQAKLFKRRAVDFWRGTGRVVKAGLWILSLSTILLLVGSPLNRPVVQILPWTENTTLPSLAVFLAAVVYLQLRVTRLFR
jgi:ubiquinone biosynthesis protein